jgi:F0F1-type ATP synthase membrane subunit b/b'
LGHRAEGPGRPLRSAAPRCARFALAISLLPGAAHAAEGGLVLMPEVPMLVGLVALFALLIAPVDRLLLQPLLRVLDERAQRIEGTRGRASRLARQAEELLGRYQRSVGEVRAEAEAQRKRALEAARAQGGARTGLARSEAEREIEAARGEVAAALADARAALRAEARELANEAAARVLGRPLS